MALINDISNVKSINKEELRIFSILLNPFAPHVTEEVYEACKLGNGILAEAEWPEYDESKCVDESVEIVVQVNGKIKAKLNIPVDADKDAVLDLAKNDENVKKSIDGMKIRVIMYNNICNYMQITHARWQMGGKIDGRD